jgi:hypothetical protein
MILYKYVSFGTGKTILESNSVCFSQPKDFNDPFDLPSYPAEEVANPVVGIFSQIRVMAKNSIWSENTGILPLTRTPTNPLMWAHYADMHRGLVIGINVAAAGFTDEKTNLIPAQFGSVIYVSRRSSEPFIDKPQSGIAVGSTYHFPRDHYEKLQRLFLHKPLYWSYEEEVRVLKCLKAASPDTPETPSGKFNVVSGKGRTLFLYMLPANSIRELYVGYRSDHRDADALVAGAKKFHPQLAAFECHLEESTLSVGFGEYIPTKGE